MNIIILVVSMWLLSANVVLHLCSSTDTYIQKARKTYTDSRVRRNLNSLNNELQDVQRIMVQNIDDVLQRGTVLSGWCLMCVCG